MTVLSPSFSSVPEIELPTPGFQVWPPSVENSHLPLLSMPETVIEPLPLIEPVPVLVPTDGFSMVVSLTTLIVDVETFPASSVCLTMTVLSPSFRSAPEIELPVPGFQVWPPSVENSHLPLLSMPETVIEPLLLIEPVPVLVPTDGFSMVVSLTTLIVDVETFPASSVWLTMTVLSPSSRSAAEIELPVPGFQVWPPSVENSHLPPASMPPTVTEPPAVMAPVPVLVPRVGLSTIVSLITSTTTGSLRLPSLSTCTIVILFGPSAKSLADTPLPSPLCQVLPSSRLYSQSAPGFSPVMGIDP